MMNDPFSSESLKIQVTAYRLKLWRCAMITNPNFLNCNLECRRFFIFQTMNYVLIILFLFFISINFKQCANQKLKFEMSKVHNIRLKKNTVIRKNAL